MPVPAGFQPIDAAASTPPGFQPISIADSYAKQTDSAAPSHFSEFVQNSPIGAVQGIAAAIRNPASAVHGMLKSTSDILDEAKDSFHKGDYGTAAIHFLNYALSPVGGAAMDAAGNDFAAGHFGSGLAKTAGLATTLAAGAKAPAVLDAATEPGVAEAAGRIPQAVAAGARAGTGDVLSGAGKIAGGEVLAKIPGMEYPARIGMGYPGARQVLKGFKKGGKAFSDTLSGKIQQAADTAATEAQDPLFDQIAKGQGIKGGWKSATAEQQAVIRDLAAKINGSPKQAPAQPAAQPAAAAPAVNSQGQPAAQLPAPGPAPLITPPPPDASGPIPPVLPENIRNPQPVEPSPIPADATPDVVNKFSPTDIAKWLQSRHRPGESPVVSQTDTPSIARRLRDELIANGTTPESIAPPDVPEPDLGTSLRDMMRGQPGGAPKAIADSNYAGGGHEDPEVAGKVYEAAGRADKAVKLAQSMHQHGITYADLAAHPAEDVVELLKPVAKGLGINPPSKSTLGEILFNLQRLEKAAPKSALESQLEQSLAARGAK